MQKRIRYFLLACLLLPSAAIADVTILVHGYLTNGITWDRSGIVATMEAHGWHDGGPLMAGYQAPPATQGPIIAASWGIPFEEITALLRKILPKCSLSGKISSCMGK